MARLPHVDLAMMNQGQVESLRSYAVSQGEVQFAHLCTAALSGEGWAVQRVQWTLARIADVIRATDTTRPDGGIAKSLVNP